jgi:hypothetical protein
MVTNSLNMPLVFRFHCCDEIGRSGVVAASKQEVLPDEDPFSVTDLIEIV